ncbi:hypothetical protein ABIF75_003900 [Bradyrhizobium japonicum]
MLKWPETAAWPHNSLASSTRPDRQTCHARAVRVRHPMYSAFWLWAIAQALLPNWIAGFAGPAGFADLVLWPRRKRRANDAADVRRQLSRVYGADRQDFPINPLEACPFCNICQKRDRATALMGLYLLRAENVRLGSESVRVVGNFRGDFMLKFVIAGAASLALVGAAAAADLPRPQPVVQTAPIGKYPVGKTPVGKYPIGKAPAPAPLVTKG